MNLDIASIRNKITGVFVDDLPLLQTFVKTNDILRKGNNFIVLCKQLGYDDSLEKSMLHFEWITVHKKDGTTYKRRQRKKIVESAKPENTDFEARKQEWERSGNMAWLKDALVNAVKYQGEYYNPKGERIPIPEKYRDVIESKHNSKLNASTFTKEYYGTKRDLEKEDFKSKIALIEKKNVLLERVMEKEKKFFDSGQTEQHKKNIINHSINRITEKRNSISNLLQELKVVRSTVVETIDPTMQITFKGKTQDIQLDEFIERLEKNSKEKNIYENTGITIAFKDLDSYEEDDFNKKEYTPDYKTLYTKVDKELAKQSKKK